MEVNVKRSMLAASTGEGDRAVEKDGRTKDQLREAIAKKGKAKLADLTVAEASDLIEALCKKLGIANLPVLVNRPFVHSFFVSITCFWSNESCLYCPQKKSLARTI